MSTLYFDEHLEKKHRKRKAESDKIRNKYPSRVPVLIDTMSNELNLPNHKFLVPSELTVSQFYYVVRKKINLRPEEALYFFYWDPKQKDGIGIGLNPSQRMMELYAQKRHSDGYLYIVCTSETTFGSQIGTK